MKGKHIMPFLFAMQALLSIKGFAQGFLTAPSSSRTPSLPNRGRHRRAKVHAPNDGRWHMKFHRSRH